jgi:hypothetical protein
MLNKRYYNRTDLKVLGFQNLSFYANRELNKIFLSADYFLKVGKSTYKTQFTVEAEKQNTSTRSIESLCREMVISFHKFSDMKAADQKKFAEEHGEKIDY